VQLVMGEWPFAKVESVPVVGVLCVEQVQVSMMLALTLFVRIVPTRDPVDLSRLLQVTLVSVALAEAFH
jgi:hypothetical protein